MKDSQFLFTVYTPSRNKCTSTERITLSDSTLNLASTTSSTTSCGTHDTPWLVSAKPGQRLNISMTDFTWENRTVDTPDDCNTYGYVIHESDVVTICGGRQRHKHLYHSKGHETQIVFDGFTEEQRFIIHIEGTVLCYLI